MTTQVRRLLANTSLRVGDFAVMTFSLLRVIQCNRTQRNDGRGMKVNKLDEGVGDTIGLVRSKCPDFRHRNRYQSTIDSLPLTARDPAAR
jgi:hypothetical protein